MTPKHTRITWEISFISTSFNTVNQGVSATASQYFIAPVDFNDTSVNPDGMGQVQTQESFKGWWKGGNDLDKLFAFKQIDTFDQNSVADVFKHCQHVEKGVQCG